LSDKPIIAANPEICKPDPPEIVRVQCRIDRLSLPGPRNADSFHRYRCCRVLKPRPGEIGPGKQELPSGTFRFWCQYLSLAAW
jgi:hypothetical protein